MDQPKIDPIMLDIPEHFESKRLLIRAPRSGDGVAVNEAIRESIAELRPWMPWAKDVPTPEQSEASIRRSRVEYLEREDMRLLLFDKDTGLLVGSSGLHKIDWNCRKFEIGYWVRTSCAGQGYITEAVHAITDFAVLQLQANRIQICCDSHNAASIHVAQKTGFTHEGTIRLDRLNHDGHLRDTMIFAKVRGVEFE